MKKESQHYRWYVTCPAKRPFPRAIPAFIWGLSVHFDSDGDATSNQDTAWTELYLAKRPTADGQIISIAQLNADPLVLTVESSQQQLAARAAYIVAYYTMGKIGFTAETIIQAPSELMPLLGGDFELIARLADFHQANQPLAATYLPSYLVGSFALLLQHLLHQVIDCRPFGGYSP